MGCIGETPDCSGCGNAAVCSHRKRQRTNDLAERNLEKRMRETKKKTRAKREARHPNTVAVAARTVSLLSSWEVNHPSMSALIGRQFDHDVTLTIDTLERTLRHSGVPRFCTGLMLIEHANLCTQSLRACATETIPLEADIQAMDDAFTVRLKSENGRG